MTATHGLDAPPWDDQEPPPYDDAPEPPDPGPAPTNQNANAGRPTPADPDAEAAVLGAAMDDPTAIPGLARIVTTDDFYWPNNATIWQTITHLHGADRPTQAPAVLAHLLDTGQLRPPLDGPYIHGLMLAAPRTAAHAEHYANRVDQLARRRHAIAALDRGLRALTVPGPDTDIDQAIDRALDTLTQAQENLTGLPTPTTWSPVDLEPVLAGEHLDPPPTMMLRSDGIPLLYDGSVHTISGESGSGKTWLTLIATLQLIQAGDNVLFLDFEDRADRVIGRLLALGATPTEIRDHFDYVRPDRPLDDDGRAQLAPALTGTRLVILDGVTEAMTMHGYDLNSNADSAIFQGLLPRWLADHGPAVVMIDHVVKNKEQQDRFALGAQHKLAGIDGVAYIVKMIQPFSRGKRGLAKLEVAKDRPGHVLEHAFGRTIAEFTLDATAGDLVLIASLVPPGAESGRIPGQKAFEPTGVMESVSRYVQANPGMSKKSIENAVNGKTTTIRLALELLVTRGYIGTKIGTRNAVQHFHEKPYYQSDDPTDHGSTDPYADPDETTHDDHDQAHREAS